MKVKNFAHKIGVILFVYFAFSVLVYMAIAFVRVEINPVLWKMQDRSNMLFVIYSAMSVFSPALFYIIRIEEKK